MLPLRVVDVVGCVPERIVSNAQLSALTGRPPHWFERVTGIVERRRAAPDQTCDDMAVDAARLLASRNPDCLRRIDLIIGCTYTPHDTIGTLAHVVQRALGIDAPRAFTLSSACSSMVNGLELAAGMVESGRARSALIVGADHNSLYARDDDDRAGHLWGDGAAAVLLEAGAGADEEYTLLDVISEGRALLGAGPKAISLASNHREIFMADGRAVFTFACRELERISRLVLARNRLDIDDLALISPHQANRRILDHVATALGFPADRVAMTIERYGNTGCPSAFITLFDQSDRLRPGDLVLVPVFGGGYSVGAALLQRRTGRPRDRKV